MKRTLNFYFKLFVSTFYISMFTFGGGFVILSLMRKKFVEGYHWIEEEEMLEMTAIAQSSPGAIAVNAAIIIGYRLAGGIGAIISILGTVLPPLIILSLISFAYISFRDNQMIHYMLRGMQAGVAAVILEVSISMMSEMFKNRKIFSSIIFGGAFISTFFLHIKTAYVILVSGALGGIVMLYSLKIVKSGGKR